MILLRRHWLALLFVALAFCLTVATWHHLPALMPVHWGLDGHVDGWMRRSMGAVILPMVSLLSTLLMIGAPRLVWHTASSEPRIYPTLVATLGGFLLFMHALLLLFAMGTPLSMLRLMGVATGVLIAVTGNFMGKLPRNRLIGFRLPWTLANDEVWERTHRFAAPIMVAGGLVLFIVSLARQDIRTPLPMLAILLVTTTIPVVKSWLIWRSVQGS